MAEAATVLAGVLSEEALVIVAGTAVVYWGSALLTRRR